MSRVPSHLLPKPVGHTESRVGPVPAVISSMAVTRGITQTIDRTRSKIIHTSSMTANSDYHRYYIVKEHEVPNLGSRYSFHSRKLGYLGR